MGILEANDWFDRLEPSKLIGSVNAVKSDGVAERFPMFIDMSATHEKKASFLDSIGDQFALGGLQELLDDSVKVKENRWFSGFEAEHASEDEVHSPVLKNLRFN